jgi:formylglycine-generating enzyme required for sulfatase activity
MNDPLSQYSCPACGEPVKSTWRICPACETRLHGLTCPRCEGEVKANWRRCPECEALLVCPQCGRRLAGGELSCSRCGSVQTVKEEGASLFKDPVCGIEFVRVTGGTFRMGDTLGCGVDSEQPVHEVTLDDFYMARFPVTQAHWDILMEDNPSDFVNPENPVVQMTWSDACDFAGRLTAAVQSDGLFRLPSEAQWEYAARGRGRDDLYAGGADIDTVAWYADNSQGRPQAVGQKQPNSLGLYDMSGNVWEWCLDTFREDAYRRHAKRNPVEESAGPDRVIRGGSWNLDAWSARCARRFNFRSDFFGPALGFRLVMIMA